MLGMSPCQFQSILWMCKQKPMDHHQMSAKLCRWTARLFSAFCGPGTSQVLLGTGCDKASLVNGRYRCIQVDHFNWCQHFDSRVVHTDGFWWPTAKEQYEGEKATAYIYYIYLHIHTYTYMHICTYVFVVFVYVYAYTHDMNKLLILP